MPSPRKRVLAPRPRSKQGSKSGGLGAVKLSPAQSGGDCGAKDTPLCQKAATSSCSQTIGQQNAQQILEKPHSSAPTRAATGALSEWSAAFGFDEPAHSQPGKPAAKQAAAKPKMDASPNALFGQVQRGFKALLDGETYVSDRDRAASARAPVSPPSFFNKGLNAWSAVSRAAVDAANNLDSQIGQLVRHGGAVGTSPNLQQPTDAAADVVAADEQVGGMSNLLSALQQIPKDAADLFAEGLDASSLNEFLSDVTGVIVGEPSASEAAALQGDTEERRAVAQRIAALKVQISKAQRVAGAPSSPRACSALQSQWEADLAVSPTADKENQGVPPPHQDAARQRQQPARQQIDWQEFLGGSNVAPVAAPPAPTSGHPARPSARRQDSTGAPSDSDSGTPKQSDGTTSRQQAQGRKSLNPQSWEPETPPQRHHKPADDASSAGDLADAEAAAEAGSAAAMLTASQPDSGSTSDHVAAASPCASPPRPSAARRLAPLSPGPGTDPINEQVRSQLESLLSEKAALAQENARLHRENTGLQELLSYTMNHAPPAGDIGDVEDALSDWSYCPEEEGIPSIENGMSPVKMKMAQRLSMGSVNDEDIVVEPY